MIEVTMFILMVTIFATYTTFITLEYGVLPSLSESFYRLKGNYKWFFTLFCWGIAIPAIVIGNSPLMFIAGSGIAFVGAATSFKEKLTSVVHTAGAVIGIMASQFSIFWEYDMFIVNLITIGLITVIYVFRDIIRNHIWWIEITAFLSIIYTLYFQL